MNNNNLLAENASIAEVNEHIKTYMKRNLMSTTEMAKHLNWARSTFTMFMNGNYSGNNESLRMKAIEFFALNVDLPETPTELYVPTMQAKMVQTACRFAQRKGLLAIILGNAGVGKTTALEEYTRRNSQAVMVTAYPRIPSSTLFKRLCMKLRYKTDGDDAMLIERLISKLKGKNILIIVDEGHYVKRDLLEKIRHIQDLTGVGVILCGNFDLHERMTGKESVQYAHLYSRAAMKVRVIEDIDKKELSEIMGRRDVPTDKSSLEFMAKKAAKPGHYRIIRNIIEIANEVALLKNEHVKLEHLVEASQMIME